MKSIYKYKCSLVQEDVIDYEAINDVEHAAKLAQSLIADEPEENVIVLAMDCRGDVIGIHYVSRGTATASLVSVPAIFKRLLLNNATSFILAHNHPSGMTSPSEEDVKITKQLKRAGSTMQIKMMDHVIVSKYDYYSFRANRNVL